MKNYFNIFILFILPLPLFGNEKKRERIELAAVPSVSPDGSQFAFVWRGDIWVAGIGGGHVRQLTRHPAEEHWPSWSPDGKQIAFAGKRDGYWNIYTISSSGGLPVQVSKHSEGYTPLEWFPDGKFILAKVRRDHGGFDSTRLVRVDLSGVKDDQILFDASARHGALSPDGSKILFVREGGNMLYRKGYRGPRSSQIWLFDLKSKKFKSLCVENYGCRSPLWKPDGTGFYYVCDKDGCFNMWHRDLSSNKNKQLTFFNDDSVIVPRISRNGQTIIFRTLFDFYSFNPQAEKEPVKINLWSRQDSIRKASRRRWYDTIWNNESRQGIGWADDFLEIVFSAGGDLWVMDTVLREPTLICGDTSSHETEAVFSNENKEIWFLRDFGNRTEIWKAKRNLDDKFWFENDQFEKTRFSSHDSKSNKNRLSISPDGKLLAFCRGTGELVVTPTDKFSPRALISSTVFPGYDWSPDGSWLAVQAKDSNDNWDVWIVSATNEVEPYNVSRHPNWDGSPRWSPDGRMLAFVGRRGRNDEMDLHYAYFVTDDEVESQRSSKLEDARRKIRTSRVSRTDDSPRKAEKIDPAGPPLPKVKPTKKIPRVVIDFEDLHDRIRRIELSGSKETDPFWHKESQKLAFSSDFGGNRGVYQMQFPDELDKPKLVTKTIGSDPHWVGSAIHWMVGNLPAKSQGSSLTKFTFKAYQDTNREQYLRLAYRILWRNLRDFFYDDKMNGKDWNALLAKYENRVSANIDKAAFGRLISLLIGELNASHLFFELNDKIWPHWQPDHGWRWETVHLGLFYDNSYKGSGLRINKVLQGGPCSKSKTQVYEGEILLSMDGIPLDSAADRRKAFNRRLNKVVQLEVKDPVGNVRTVTIEPISFSKARELARESMISSNQSKVDELSDEKLGYLHVSRMNWDELERFESELFSIGYGKQGLIIDVRNNVGGFTADRMLKMLLRPLHAVTIPRSGKRSYPIGYLDHYFWDKPIVVLCNQNTASNGEIFCHAIKSSKRGKLVGVRTAGSVISVYTEEKFLDVGKMSIPFRGWFKADDGRDMELNGAIPDYEIWPKPGEVPSEEDSQLEKAVEILLKECKEFKDATLVELEPASTRSVSSKKNSKDKKRIASEKN